MRGRPKIRRHVLWLVALVLIAAACGDDDAATTTTAAATTTTAAATMTTAAAATTTTAAPAATTTTAAPATTTTTLRAGTYDAGYGPVRIEGTPERVYAWGLQEAETLAVLGFEPVGYTTRGDSPMPFWFDVSWPNTTPLAQPPSLEQVVALQPDLILSDESNDVAAMRDIAPVLRMRANSYGQAMSQLLMVGEMLGRADAANEFVDAFYAELAETTDAIAGREPVTLMVVYPGAEPGVLGMWLDTSFTGSLMTALGTNYVLNGTTLGQGDLGGRNAEFSTRFGLVQLGLEKALELDPDVLFVLGTDAFVEELSANPAWAALSAVANDNVSVFDRDLWSRSRGPLAALLMLREARAALYPDLFG